MYLYAALFGLVALALLVLGPEVVGTYRLNQQIGLCYNTSNSAEARLDCIDQAYVRALFKAETTFTSH